MPYSIYATYRDRPDRLLGQGDTLDEARSKAISLWDGDIWHIHIKLHGYYSGQLYYYKGWKWNNGKMVRQLNKNGTIRKK